MLQDLRITSPLASACLFAILHALEYFSPTASPVVIEKGKVWTLSAKLTSYMTTRLRDETYQVKPNHVTVGAALNTLCHTKLETAYPVGGDSKLRWKQVDLEILVRYASLYGYEDTKQLHELYTHRYGDQRLLEVLAP